MMAKSVPTTLLFLSCGGNSEETHSDRERTCKLHTERPPGSAGT